MAKKARTSREAAPEVPLQHLIAKCPRSELEDLLLAAAEAGNPTRDALEAAAARHAPPPRAVIELGDEREGTGAFDVVDSECLGHILEYVAMSSRLKLAGVVCKSWRRLRTAKGLWTSFCLNSSPTVLRGNSKVLEADEPLWEPTARVLTRNENDGHRCPWIRTQGVMQLLDWVVDKDAVVELNVNTSNEALSSDAVVAAISAFPNLRTLCLDGKKIIAKVLRTRYPCLQKLKTLVVGTMVPGASRGAFAQFLSACVSLETLCAPGELANYTCLEAAAASWKAARGGAKPLLQNLKLYGHCAYNESPWATPASVGGWFDLSAFAFPLVLRRDVNTAAATNLPTFCRLEHVKSLHVGPLGSFDYHYTTEQLGALLAALLLAAPNVEHFRLQHGRCDPYHDQALPALNGALAVLPSSLETLDLTHVVVKADDLVDNCLRAVRMKDCMLDDGKDGNENLVPVILQPRPFTSESTEAKCGLEDAWAVTIGEVPWPTNRQY